MCTCACTQPCEQCVARTRRQCSACVHACACATRLRRVSARADKQLPWNGPLPASTTGGSFCFPDTADKPAVRSRRAVGRRIRALTCTAALRACRSSAAPDPPPSSCARTCQQCACARRPQPQRPPCAQSLTQCSLARRRLCPTAATRPAATAAMGRSPAHEVGVGGRRSCFPQTRQGEGR